MTILLDDSSTPEEFCPSHSVITPLEFRRARFVFDIGELRAVTNSSSKNSRETSSPSSES